MRQHKGPLNDLLKEAFGLGRKPRRKYHSSYRYEIDGRIFNVERSGRIWTGWFEDDHSVEYESSTRRDLLASVM